MANTNWTETTHPYSGAPRTVLVVDHGLRDEKGRAVGGIAIICAETEGENAGQFILWVCAARDGKEYGASPRSHLYDTLEQAQAAGEKDLAAQAKRYSKKYTPKAG